MVGLAPKAKILPLRTLRTRKDPMRDMTWAAALRYAVEEGAQVFPMSFANDMGKTSLDGREAIAYAQEHDVVLVTGAGNEGATAVSDDRRGAVCAQEMGEDASRSHEAEPPQAQMAVMASDPVRDMDPRSDRLGRLPAVHAGW
ncbi:S8 family serine peptidase [Streptomyces sp. KAU_LT]|uniref:S8 family serine peptidase n=1 Tax=Streptomyces sp. KAU_LT TaxID=3046669 RepID=UPI0024B6E416|nr:S8 family serine peptidase [Streptomyces sp. KAU_LT]MDI9832770.1 S8 family serine peptidase [Streptomyces sp. KAU_LT]